jgi:phospholipid transport system transporter-binding protein
VQLSQAEITQQNQHEYFISGTVDFSTVPGLMQRASIFFNGYNQQSAPAGVTVDLSQITTCDSTGLALMLEMLKDARSKKIELHFKNLPEALLTIAKAYGVESEIRDISQ